MLVILTVCDQVYLPVAKTGFRQITQGLLSETYLEAHVSVFIHVIVVV